MLLTLMGAPISYTLLLHALYTIVAVAMSTINCNATFTCIDPGTITIPKRAIQLFSNINANWGQ